MELDAWGHHQARISHQYLNYSLILQNKTTPKILFLKNIEKGMQIVQRGDAFSLTQKVV